MKDAIISRGGQISVPATVRRRWATSRVVLEDRGTYLIVRPIPDDPIAAARGSLAGPGPSSDELRRVFREEEARAEERRHG